MRFAKVVICSLIIAYPVFSDAFTFTGLVTDVHDGDTVKIKTKRTSVKVRLSEIDAPEFPCQAFGPEARALATTLTLGQTVRVTWAKTDRYQRRLGTVWLADGTTLNARLIQSGLAWSYTAYKPSASIVAGQAEAREARRGLWQEVSPMAPWTFRKLHGPCHK